MKLSMVATLTGSYSFHKPPSPRNVGMPLSADTPAPVSASARLAPASSRAASSMLKPLLRQVARGLSREDQLAAVGAPDRGVPLARGFSRKRHPRRAGVLADRHHLVHAELVGGLALQLQPRHLLDGDVVLACVQRGLADQNCERRRDAAETRGRVHRVAE